MFDRCQIPTFAAILRTRGTFIVGRMCLADTLKLPALNSIFHEYCI
jgi:hypothetical protein